MPKPEVGLSPEELAVAKLLMMAANDTKLKRSKKVGRLARHFKKGVKSLLEPLYTVEINGEEKKVELHHSLIKIDDEIYALGGAGQHLGRGSFGVVKPAIKVVFKDGSPEVECDKDGPVIYAIKSQTIAQLTKKEEDILLKIEEEESSERQRLGDRFVYEDFKSSLSQKKQRVLDKHSAIKHRQEIEMKSEFDIGTELDFTLGTGERPKPDQEQLKKYSVSKYGGKPLCYQHDNEMAEKLTFGCVRQLAKMHKKEILHRDVKPENFLSQNGDVTIIDFGLAKKFVGYDGTNVYLDSASGSPKYMSPAAKNGVFSFGTDIYALGIGLLDILPKESPIYSLAYRMTWYYFDLAHNHVNNHYNIIMPHIEMAMAAFEKKDAASPSEDDKKNMAVCALLMHTDPHIIFPSEIDEMLKSPGVVLALAATARHLMNLPASAANKEEREATLKCVHDIFTHRDKPDDVRRIAKEWAAPYPSSSPRGNRKKHFDNIHQSCNTFRRQPTTSGQMEIMRDPSSKQVPTNEDNTRPTRTRFCRK